MAYNWLVPSFGPTILPWLVILALLALKPNRCWRAWWIVLPLGLIAASGYIVRDRASSAWFFSEGIDAFGRFLLALVFGLAATWLLAGRLVRKRRPLTFVALFLIQSAFAILTFASVTEWGNDFMHPLLLAGLAGCVLILTAAMVLAGMLCRGRYGFWRNSGWLIVCLGGQWLLVGAVVGLMAPLWNETTQLWPMLYLVLVVTGICFLLILPFLILSAANALYRERLKDLLNLSV